MLMWKYGRRPITVLCGRHATSSFGWRGGSFQTGFLTGEFQGPMVWGGLGKHHRVGEVAAEQSTCSVEVQEAGDDVSAALRIVQDILRTVQSYIITCRGGMAHF